MEEESKLCYTHFVYVIAWLFFYATGNQKGKMKHVRRREHKNRRLWTGESHDKDGRYVYKYTDVFGRRKIIYSWRLTEADTTPKGKKERPFPA